MAIPFPVPGTGRTSVAVPAPGSGPGHWAGAPSGAFAPDGTLIVAYRLRSPDRRGASVVIAKAGGDGRLETLSVLKKESFGAESLERPALVRLDPGWRVYISCATPQTKHWRIDALDAKDLARLDRAEVRTVFPGDERTGVKDPVIRRTKDGWLAWICCHPLDVAGEEDRMTTGYATSPDGLDWRWHGEALAGRAGHWDARGARVTSVLGDGRASYDGRATREENFRERTGVAAPAVQAGRLAQLSDAPVAEVRYLDLVPDPSGGFVALYERPRPDGSHELCLERFD